MTNDDVKPADIERQLKQRENDILSGRTPVRPEPTPEQAGWGPHKSAIYGENSYRLGTPFASNGMTGERTPEMLRFASEMATKGVEVQWGWRGDNAYAYVDEKDALSLANLKRTVLRTPEETPDREPLRRDGGENARLVRPRSTDPNMDPIKESLRGRTQTIQHDGSRLFDVSHLSSREIAGLVGEMNARNIVTRLVPGTSSVEVDPASLDSLKGILRSQGPDDKIRQTPREQHQRRVDAPVESHSPDAVREALEGRTFHKQPDGSARVDIAKLSGTEKADLVGAMNDRGVLTRLVPGGSFLEIAPESLPAAQAIAQGEPPPPRMAATHPAPDFAAHPALRGNSMQQPVVDAHAPAAAPEPPLKVVQPITPPPAGVQPKQPQMGARMSPEDRAEYIREQEGRRGVNAGAAPAPAPSTTTTPAPSTTTTPAPAASNDNGRGTAGAPAPANKADGHPAPGSPPQPKPEAHTNTPPAPDVHEGRTVMEGGAAAAGVHLVSGRAMAGVGPRHVGPPVGGHREEAGTWRKGHRRGICRGDRQYRLFDPRCRRQGSRRGGRTTAGPAGAEARARGRAGGAGTAGGTDDRPGRAHRRHRPDRLGDRRHRRRHRRRHGRPGADPGPRRRIRGRRGRRRCRGEARRADLHGAVQRRSGQARRRQRGARPDRARLPRLPPVRS
ncbi:MAG: hypothetical protein WDN72_08590 [Alphaproteobacteria bacterium]